VPIPVRPFARLALLINAPKRTPRSAAGPHWSTWMRLSSSSSQMASSTSAVNCPQRWAASRSSASPSWIHRYTGRSAWPWITIPSKPAPFSSAGQNSPDCESPTRSVTGDLSGSACSLSPAGLLLAAYVSGDSRRPSRFRPYICGKRLSRALLLQFPCRQVNVQYLAVVSVRQNNLPVYLV